MGVNLRKGEANALTSISCFSWSNILFSAYFLRNMIFSATTCLELSSRAKNTFPNHYTQFTYWYHIVLRLVPSWNRNPWSTMICYSIYAKIDSKRIYHQALGITTWRSSIRLSLPGKGRTTCYRCVIEGGARWVAHPTHCKQLINKHASENNNLIKGWQ